MNTPEGPMERPAFVYLDGWAGRVAQRVVVVGETKKRFRIRAVTRTTTAGRSRFLNPGETVLVPKDAVSFNEPTSTPIIT